MKNILRIISKRKITQYSQRKNVYQRRLKMTNGESVRLNMKFARDMIIYSIEKDKLLTKRVLKEVLL